MMMMMMMTMMCVCGAEKKKKKKMKMKMKGVRETMEKKKRTIFLIQEIKANRILHKLIIKTDSSKKKERCGEKKDS